MNSPRTVFITIEDARRLPNMLGKIAPAMLETKGGYAAELNGEKIRFKLKTRVGEMSRL